MLEFVCLQTLNSRGSFMPLIACLSVESGKHTRLPRFYYHKFKSSIFSPHHFELNIFPDIENCPTVVMLYLPGDEVTGLWFKIFD